MKRAESLSKGDVVALWKQKHRDPHKFTRLYRVMAHDAIQHKISFVLIGSFDYPHNERYLVYGYNETNERCIYLGKTPVWWKRLFKKYD